MLPAPSALMLGQLWDHARKENKKNCKKTLDIDTMS